MQAQQAIKNELSTIALPCLVASLQKEKQAIESELHLMPPDAWLNARGRALINREQELHTTLNVLRNFKHAPAQISEPSL